MRQSLYAALVLGILGALVSACSEGGSASECFDGVGNDHNGKTDCDSTAECWGKNSSGQASPP